MTTLESTRSTESEDPVVSHGLAGLRRAAPREMASTVLDRLGLADAYVRVEGPIGPLFVAYGARGISLVERAHDLVQKVIDGRVWGRADRPVKVALDLTQLPEFERSVLMKTLEIPRGEVRPYAWVAAEIGRPLAVRAVGNALARNPVPFVVPCHRVVRSDGRIGNYGAGGPEAKRAILESEGLNTDELERLPAANVRFIGSDTTRIYCYPSCR